MGRVEKHAFHALTPTCAPGRGVRSQRARGNAVGGPTVSNDSRATGAGRMPSSNGPRSRGSTAGHRHGRRVHRAGGWHSVIRTPTQGRARGPDAEVISFRLFDFFFSNHRRSFLPARRTVRRRVDSRSWQIGAGGSPDLHRRAHRSSLLPAGPANGSAARRRSAGEMRDSIGDRTAAPVGMPP